MTKMLGSVKSSYVAVLASGRRHVTPSPAAELVAASTEIVPGSANSDCGSWQRKSGTNLLSASEGTAARFARAHDTERKVGNACRLGLLLLLVESPEDCRGAAVRVVEVDERVGGVHLAELLREAQSLVRGVGGFARGVDSGLGGASEQLADRTGGKHGALGERGLAARTTQPGRAPCMLKVTFWESTVHERQK